MRYLLIVLALSIGMAAVGWTLVWVLDTEEPFWDCTIGLVNKGVCEP